MSLAEASTSLRAPEKTEPYDVCIIGSGFVGIVVGTSLVEKGVSTVMVESGTSLVRWLLDPRMKKLAMYEVEGDTNYPTTRTKVRARGGNSNFWTGRTERLRPSDFEDNSYTPSDASWPVTYAEMDHYYARAEQLLRVRGAPLSDYYPPRLNGGSILPGRDISSLKNLMEESGVVVDNSPTATPEKGWRTYRPTTELLPKFRKSPHGTLVTGLTVTRLITDADGKITAAEARNMLGEFKTIRAKIFLVACGGIETPRLLLLSRSETFPKGIGNSYDRVGRGFNEHPGVNFYGRFSHRRSTLLPHYRLGRSHQFYDDFKSQGLGGVLPVFIQSWAFPNHLVQYRIKDLARQSKLWLSRMVRPEFYIGASIEMEPVDENRVTLSDSKRDRFGNPLAKLSFNFTERDNQTLERTRDLIRDIFAKMGGSNVREGELTWSRHHIGTCRMGDNPKTSVVDRNLRVHGSPNLFIGGCETFVTGGAVPPVLTITALSHRLSDHLIERLKKG